MKKQLLIVALKDNDSPLGVEAIEINDSTEEIKNILLEYFGYYFDHNRIESILDQLVYDGHYYGEGLDFEIDLKLINL